MDEFLRYGLFGRPLLRILNGEATPFRFMLFAVFAVLLIFMVILTITKFRMSLVVDLAFVLCFGYIMGVAMAATVIVLGIIFGGISILGGNSNNASGTQKNDDLDQSSVSELNRLGEKARNRLSGADYARMETEAKFIRNKTDLENFVNKWEREIEISPVKTDDD